MSTIDSQLPGTSPEIISRLEVIKGMFVNGMTQSAIVDKCFKEQGWDISRRQIKRYCLKARSLLTNGFMQTSYAEKMALAEHRFVNIYHKALEAGDYGQARMANIAYVQLQKEIALHKLEPPKQLERKALEAGLSLDMILNHTDHSEGVDSNVISGTNTSVQG